MIRRNSLFVLLVLVVATTHVCSAKNECTENFQLDKTEGSAPLTVRITSPHVILERWQQWHKFGPNRGGPGFSVQWGDSVRGDCEVNHVFAVPGTYVVKASPYYCAPSDAGVTYWRGQSTVTVTEPSY